MAATVVSSSMGGIPIEIPIDSHDTAICIIPPGHMWPSFDALRSQYDKSYGKWPPHINLVYPFVNPDALSRAASLITSNLQLDSESIPITLNSAGVFHQKHKTVVFSHDSNADHVIRLKQLRNSILASLGQKEKDSDFKHHLTIGQTTDDNDASVNGDRHKFLAAKIELLPSPEWRAERMYLLQRERVEVDDGNFTSAMKVWGSIDIKTRKMERYSKPLSFDEMNSNGTNTTTNTTTNLLVPVLDRDRDRDSNKEASPFSCPPCSYSPKTSRWTRYQHMATQPNAKEMPKNIAVGSYNVLAEFSHPPSQVRYPVILSNIFTKSAFSDILVLQEVTDDFLSYLLRDERVRERYGYVSHGPPDQPEVNPLPNHVNIVVLSKFPFTWNCVSLKSPHKTSIIATFPTIGKFVDLDGVKTFIPTVLATVHLTCGLTDASVVSKKTELRALLSHLEANFDQNPCIIAGDFNMSTSSYTIGNFVKNKTIESKTATSLAGLDTTMSEAGLLDTWMTAHLERAHVAESDDEDDVYMGEQGSTFDPLKNPLARATVGTGFNSRPQRYDRILVRSEGLFGIIGFSRFGYLTEVDEAGEVQHASDHWGVRCGLSLTPEASEHGEVVESAHVVPVELKMASHTLYNPDNLTAVLSDHGAFPSETDINQRKSAIELVRKILIEDSDPAKAEQSRTHHFNEVLVPVGSYGLGVWTPSSDLDCMVIGRSSSKTFMTVATHKLRKASSEHDIRIIRRVRAKTGTMLELSVEGIKMDLQYCPAPAVAENWPSCLRLPSNDPIFRLPAQSLAKLKAARDLWFVKGSVPDLAVFRLAYRVVREWATVRGIYAARFGYLGGIHISILLARVQKMLAAETSSGASPISATDLLTTFFAHYAAFDWRKDLVFDPFFHRSLRYPRSSQREPLSILGWHPPQLNTAHAASVSSMRTLAAEMARANKMLTAEDMTWSRFLSRGDIDGKDNNNNNSAREFLQTYKSYVKIDVHYWGLSLAKGSSLVGWLESRCVSLLVDLNIRLPNVHARIWPGRFVNPTSEEDKQVADDDKADQGEYQGYYLIGLGRWEDNDKDNKSTPTTKEDQDKAHGTLLSVLRRFITHIQEDSRYYDPNWAWVTSEIVRAATISGLQLDDREWGDYLAPGDDLSSDDEEEEDSDADSADDDDNNDGRGGVLGLKASRIAKPIGAGKFRTSSDVINRLRWDPSLDSGDYLVCYEDRFLGIMERSLDLWKTEQTDEEFIPQHRIVYFKRKTDGEVVWDRRTRKDVIFGSG